LGFRAPLLRASDASPQRLAFFVFFELRKKKMPFLIINEQSETEKIYISIDIEIE
jgi:hypothetical protein